MMIREMFNNHEILLLNFLSNFTVLRSLSAIKCTIFDLVLVVSIGRGSSATMVNVLTTPHYKAVLRSKAYSNHYFAHIK